MNTKITLDSLLGEHVLTGASYDCIQEPEYEGSDFTESKQVLRFTLDGQHYEAVQDPSDGYRSRLGRLATSDIPPSNTFPPQRVNAEMADAPEDAEDWQRSSFDDEILQFLNYNTGKPILEIGTADTSDYYPGCVLLFKPDHLD